ncbi:MAG: thioredoxin domain-containing protein, partial [Pedobacter sp.]
TNKAADMLSGVHSKIKTYGSAYSNWAIQLLNEVYGTNEIAITGVETDAVKLELSNHYIPNKIMLGGVESNLPLLKGKASNNTKIYVCRNKVCQLPVTNVDDALAHLK